MLLHCTLFGSWDGNKIWLIMMIINSSKYIIIKLLIFHKFTYYVYPSQMMSTSWRKCCRQCGMICHRTPSTRSYWVKRLRACVKAGGRHFEHVFKKLFLQSFGVLGSCDSPKCEVSMFSFDFNTSIMMKIVIFIVVILDGSVVTQLQCSRRIVHR